MSIKECLEAFVAHVQALREEDESGDDGYTKEFQILKQQSNQYRMDGTFSTIEGEREYNKRKNRYKDILPFDYTRVMLQTIQGLPGSDYINANYIKGAMGENSYIASQGPLSHTLADFWRMIWENKVKVIVMTANEYEGGKMKCACYWPKTPEERQYGDISVTLMEEKEQGSKDFMVRQLCAKRGQEVRIVKQLHYMAWPDHAIPSSVNPLLEMVALAREIQPEDLPPLLVHCSAGCGRTGTLCSIDYTWTLLKMGQITAELSLYDIIFEMRRQRPSSVQALDQYVLVHQAVALLFTRHLELINQHYNLPVSASSSTSDTTAPPSKVPNQELHYENVLPPVYSYENTDPHALSPLKEPLDTDHCMSTEAIPEAVQTEHCSMQTDQGTIRSEYRTIGSEHGTMRSEQGPVRSEHGTMRSEQGTMRSEPGLVRTEQMMQTDHGSLRTEHGSGEKRVASTTRGTCSSPHSCPTPEVGVDTAHVKMETNPLYDDLQSLPSYDGLVHMEDNLLYERCSASVRTKWRGAPNSPGHTHPDIPEPSPHIPLNVHTDIQATQPRHQVAAPHPPKSPMISTDGVFRHEPELGRKPLPLPKPKPSPTSPDRSATLCPQQQTVADRRTPTSSASSPVPTNYSYADQNSLGRWGLQHVARGVTFETYLEDGDYAQLKNPCRAPAVSPSSGTPIVPPRSSSTGQYEDAYSVGAYAYSGNGQRESFSDDDSPELPLKSQDLYQTMPGEQGDDESITGQMTRSLDTLSESMTTGVLTFGRRLKHRVQQTFGKTPGSPPEGLMLASPPGASGTDPPHNTRGMSIFYKGMDISFPNRVPAPRGPRQQTGVTSPDGQTRSPSARH